MKTVDSLLPASYSTDLGTSAGRRAGKVRNCLPWNGMSRIPPAFEAFAAEHFRALNEREDLSWSDACPAYALGYLTHTAYGPALDPDEAWELEAQWDELRGTSALDWPEALSIVREAWAYLAIRKTPLGGYLSA